MFQNKPIFNEAPGLDSIAFRSATKADEKALLEFTLEHSKSNHFNLPADDIQKQISWIGEGIDIKLAFKDHKMVGQICHFEAKLTELSFHRHLPYQYIRGWVEDLFNLDKRVGFVSMVVVDKDLRGQGIATRLYEEVKQDFKERGIKSIYVTRDAANWPSKKSMEKAGFREVAVFPDKFRENGSGQTSVSKLKL